MFSPSPPDIRWVAAVAAVRTNSQELTKAIGPKSKVNLEFGLLQLPSEDDSRLLGVNDSQVVTPEYHSP
jgi:hypothetical protein